MEENDTTVAPTQNLVIPHSMERLIDYFQCIYHVPIAHTRLWNSNKIKSSTIETSESAVPFDLYFLPLSGIFCLSGSLFLYFNLTRFCNVTALSSAFHTNEIFQSYEQSNDQIADFELQTIQSPGLWSIQTTPYLLLSLGYLLFSVASLSFCCRSWQCTDFETLPFQCCLAIGNLCSAAFTLIFSKTDKTVKVPLDTMSAALLNPVSPLKIISSNHSIIYPTLNNNIMQEYKTILVSFGTLGASARLIGLLGLACIICRRWPPILSKLYVHILFVYGLSVLSALVFGGAVYIVSGISYNVFGFQTSIIVSCLTSFVASLLEVIVYQSVLYLKERCYSSTWNMLKYSPSSNHYISVDMDDTQR